MTDTISHDKRPAGQSIAYFEMPYMQTCTLLLRFWHKFWKDALNKVCIVQQLCVTNSMQCWHQFSGCRYPNSHCHVVWRVAQAHAAVHGDLREGLCQHIEYQDTEASNVADSAEVKLRLAAIVSCHHRQGRHRDSSAAILSPCVHMLSTFSLRMSILSTLLCYWLVLWLSVITSTFLTTGLLQVLKRSDCLARTQQQVHST